MALKFSKAIWFISILCLLATLLYIYASLPEEVKLFQGGLDAWYLGREAFFYIALIAITSINSLVFLVSALFRKDLALRTWFNGLVVVLNLFFIMSLMVLNTINSHEKFNFADIGFIVYGCVILIAVWALGWPVYYLIRKFSGKAAV